MGNTSLFHKAHIVAIQGDQHLPPTCRDAVDPELVLMSGGRRRCFYFSQRFKHICICGRHSAIKFKWNKLTNKVTQWLTLHPARNKI